MNTFINTITSKDNKVRNKAFKVLCNKLTTKEIISQLDELELFRHETKNLYERVRACMFLYYGYRFILMDAPEIAPVGYNPKQAFNNILERRFEEAINLYRKEIKKEGYNATLLSGLAKAYHKLTFKILADQVKSSVRSSTGNRWMFRHGHAQNHAIRVHEKLRQKSENVILFPVLFESTSVRMDLTHSGWSDIFFLGMDYPEGANVINISVDLGVYKRDKDIKPPLESYFRVISEPLIRLTSIDLGVTKDIESLSDLFNFGNDYLSLLKAGVIASGIIPPSFEGTTQKLTDILTAIVGKGMGFELVTKVNDIPKGSRFAVSTNLLGCIISCIMRATQQTETLYGTLTEDERRLVASRAILGEWLGGSGGGWQDSGGVWPGIKTIQGDFAEPGDPEFGISRGCLLPKHKVLTEELPEDIDEIITGSLITFHGGMAQNVGPILEMVTERYLLRSEQESVARDKTNKIFNQVIDALKEGNVKKLASLTHENWVGPLKEIIPWISSRYVETIIKKAKERFGDDFYGFQMLGGMSGGGMGMYVNPARYDELKGQLLNLLLETKKEFETSLPFAMDPVVYNIKINNKGTSAVILEGEKAQMPDKYYELQVPELASNNPDSLSYLRKAEFDFYISHTKNSNVLLRKLTGSLFKVSDPVATNKSVIEDKKTASIKKQTGFDAQQHEELRNALKKSKISISNNRLSPDTLVEDVKDTDIKQYDELSSYVSKGEEAIKKGEVGVISLAAGVGSRWTNGAGVIKGINPFIEIEGIHRNFIEIHIAKTNKLAQQYDTYLPHILTTSYLTEAAIREQLRINENYGYTGPVYVSEGKSIGQRFIPMVHDLQFLWQESKEEQLDEQKEKVRDAVRKALMSWARGKGEGSDYVDNIASQRLSPLGHWYEVSNLLRNGTLFKVIKENPALKTLMLHNIDTMGAVIDAALLGYHLEGGAPFTFEVINRRLDDRGGGLARVNNKLKLIEGMALPREDDELALRYYNTMTTWIDIDQLLAMFGLTRETLSADTENITTAVRKMAHRMPTYVTIKNVKYRWGHGQEDIYPVCQVEKLWSDMSGLHDVASNFVIVPRMRGQQLKDAAQLDEWVADGSKDYIGNLCKF